MNIAQVVPVSLCDWPGRVASVVFTQGCNLCCGYCHNKHLIPETLAGLDTARIVSELEHRMPKVSGVVITGGEPTLQPDLKQFIQALPKALKVKLDTNGTRPDVLGDLLGSGLVDFVAMDIKAPWRLYHAVTGCTDAQIQAIKLSIKSIENWGVPHMFRTTKIPGLCSDTEWDEVKAQLPRTSTHRWQQYRDASTITG